MAYDPGALDAALAAAVGDEPALVAELRAAFIDSATRAVDAMAVAANAAEWRIATYRLKGLAASFGAVRLMALADQAAAAPVRDAATLRRAQRAVESF